MRSSLGQKSPLGCVPRFIERVKHTSGAGEGFEAVTGHRHLKLPAEKPLGGLLNPTIEPTA